MSIDYKRKNGSISIHNLKQSPEKDDFRVLKRVTFLLFSMCDFFAIVCNVWLFRFCFENGSTVIINFGKQIVVSTANTVDKISVIPGVPYNRVFMWNFHFAYLSQSSSKV